MQIDLYSGHKMAVVVDLCTLHSRLFVFDMLLSRIIACMVLIFEAPACCAFFKYSQPIIAFTEKRTYLQKAIIYCV